MYLLYITAKSVASWSTEVTVTVANTSSRTEMLETHERASFHFDASVSSIVTFGRSRQLQESEQSVRLGGSCECACALIRLLAESLTTGAHSSSVRHYAKEASPSGRGLGEPRDPLLKVLMSV